MKILFISQFVTKGLVLSNFLRIDGLPPNWSKSGLAAVLQSLRFGWKPSTHGEKFLARPVPSGNLTYLWKIIIFNGKIQYKWPLLIDVNSHVELPEGNASRRSVAAFPAGLSYGPGTAGSMKSKVFMAVRKKIPKKIVEYIFHTQENHQEHLS